MQPDAWGVSTSHSGLGWPVDQVEFYSPYILNKELTCLFTTKDRKLNKNDVRYYMRSTMTRAQRPKKQWHPIYPDNLGYI